MSTILEESVALARQISSTLNPSEPWQPLKRIQFPHPDGAEVWENNIYEVAVRRKPTGWPFGEGGPLVQIGISTADGTPRHDWREFQWIKNDVCGPEWEAIELYPAESRLIDPSNYYILWATKNIRLGLFKGRRVFKPEEAIAPQRGWK